MQSLKEKYGGGYRILIKTDNPEVHDIILENFKNIKKLQDSQTGYLDYEIGSKDFSFYETFRFLEGDLKENKIIEDFSITQSTLEQIFIYLSKFQQQELLMN